MATHYKTLMNPEYIGAYILQPGEERTVEIKSVRQEEVTGTGGKKTMCMVATIVGHKPFILNSTNAKTIAKLHGEYIEDWAGKKINIYASITSVGGEQVQCLRIRPTVPSDKKPVINEANFTKALASIAGGTYTVKSLLEKYELTAEQSAKLPKRIEGGKA